MGRTRGLEADGSEIRRIRISRGLSRSKLADRAETSYAHLANLEKGHTPRAAEETLVRIALALAVPMHCIQREEAAEATEGADDAPRAGAASAAAATDEGSDEVNAA